MLILVPNVDSFDRKVSQRIEVDILYRIAGQMKIATLVDETVVE